ncbi:1-acylglycerol-3-phosphate O-acyltransferases, partial [Mycoplasma putrefaciens]
MVLAANHQSNLDPVVLLAINDFSKQQPVAFIAKQELW